MSDESPSTPRPGTYASLEGRVDRLERQYDSLNTTVTGMAVDVAVTRSQVEATVKGQAELVQELKALNGFMQGMVADPMASPAGRQLLARVDEGMEDGERVHNGFKQSLDNLAAESAASRLTIAKWGGGLAVLAIALNIAVPVIIRLVFH